MMKRASAQISEMLVARLGPIQAEPWAEPSQNKKEGGHDANISSFVHHDSCKRVS